MTHIHHSGSSRRPNTNPARLSISVLTEINESLPFGTYSTHGWRKANEGQ